MAAIAAKLVSSDVKIALVPTLGAINPGHLQLIQRAREMADLVVVSIFADPSEFSNEEEYRRFPRDTTRDADILRQENVDYIFIPSENEMYPLDFSTSVALEKFGSRLAGLPPAFFHGMPTAALKLWNITKPSFVFYGEKDAIQGVILRKMARDLNLAAEIVIAPVVREDSGLAYGGRNRLLTDEQAAAALVLHRCLKAAENAIAGGETHAKRILAEMTGLLRAEPMVRLEYVVLADPGTLEPVAKIQSDVLIGIGGRIGDMSLRDAMLIAKSGKT